LLAYFCSNVASSQRVSMVLLLSRTMINLSVQQLRHGPALEVIPVLSPFQCTPSLESSSLLVLVQVACFLLR